LLTIFKAVLILYLLYKFMDDIPAISEQLTGATQLPSAKNDAFKTLAKITGLTQAIVKRARRGSIKLSKNAKEQYEQKKDEDKGSSKDDK
jgi:hypothetical protein